MCSGYITYIRIMTCSNLYFAWRKIELDRSCFVLCCPILMLTDKCACVNFFTSVVIVDKQIGAIFVLSVCVGPNYIIEN